MTAAKNTAAKNTAAKTVTIAICALMLAACASQADRQREWRLFAVDKCEPVRSSGTPAFDRCVEETMAACEAGREACQQP